MYQPINITEKVFYVGVNDRHKTLFENHIPIPQGVSYNSYLIADTKVALIDTVDIGMADIFLKKVEIALTGRKIDYLVINHMEPDHSGSIRLIRERYPEIQIVGNAQTLKILQGYFGITDQVIEIKDREELDLGGRKLRFYLTPMVHWPETMMTYDTAGKILFSGDAFGSFGTLNGGVIDDSINTGLFWEEMRRYYASIVGKYGSPVQKALTILKEVEFNYICSTHGVVWRQFIAKVLDLHNLWSQYKAGRGVVIVYGTMYGNSEQMAEAIAQGVVAGGVPDVKIYDAAHTDVSYILSDIFKYCGVVIGSSTYMNELLPGVESLLREIEIRSIKNRICAAFGTCTWAGVSVKRILPFVEKFGWEIVGSVEEKQALKAEKYTECYDLGLKIAEKINQQ
ncbi:MAG: FprA family A-type flavoprotein, partial [Dysgonamonadaceae bacterium]|jgi:flavorubredoxin|nr:FprA family A-type flavoprotein [Dysgonamonadaceae bacterium]